MDRETVTAQNGVKFYIERACDFDDDGRICEGRGWFAGIIEGKNDLSGVWFETKEAALSAIAKHPA